MTSEVTTAPIDCKIMAQKLQRIHARLEGMAAALYDDGRTNMASNIVRSINFIDEVSDEFAAATEVKVEKPEKGPEDTIPWNPWWSPYPTWPSCPSPYWTTDPITDPQITWSLQWPLGGGGVK